MTQEKNYVVAMLIETERDFGLIHVFLTANSESEALGKALTHHEKKDERFYKVILKSIICVE